MEFLKELFANGALTWEQFQAAVAEKKLNIADLSSGEYVAKSKYTTDLTAKDEQIKTLNDTLSARDGDLKNVKKQLEEAGTDKGKLSELSTELETLKTKYDADTASYKEKLAKQEYEFAVKEFANGKKFTSNAAKRDFINSLTKAELKMNEGSIMGAEDFVTKYTADNADAFLTEKPDNPDNTPAPKPPAFSAPTVGQQAGAENSNPFSFNFLGVRPQRKE